jgi:hypothetical protein
MSIVDKVLEFITTDLDIEITENNKELITDKFNPEIKNRINWYYGIDHEIYEGMITKRYEKIEELSAETEIYFNYFNEFSKVGGYQCKIKHVSFKYEVDTLKQMYDEEERYDENS